VRKIKLIVCLVMILVPQQMVQAQYLLKLSDEDCVSLSLDMIRKGIQRQSVGSVMRVIGPSVLVQGADRESDSRVAQILDEVFANSSSRDRVEGEKALPRSVKAMESDLWDFDILSAEVTVNSDSAVVECELVLWEAIPTGSSKVGSKTFERFVFWSPFENQPSMTESNNPHRWKLVGCDNLFEFLTSYGKKIDQMDDGGGGRR